ncbi:MAG: hypothetical protein IJR02_13345 [Bacteroidaceae bacterium]|nr:hypothetical protein [Bacteroidaceae bacterium]
MEGIRDVSQQPNRALALPLRGLGGFITFHLVAACWVLFRASSFGVAEQIFMQIWNKFEPQIFFQWCESYAAVGGLMLLGYLLHFMPQSLSDKTKDLVTRSPLSSRHSSSSSSSLSSSR